MVMIRLAAICEALLPGVREEDVRWRVQVSGVKLRDDGVGVIVEYADGTTESADLVIGANGMRSKVKDSLFKGQFPTFTSKFISKFPGIQNFATHSGLTGVGGFIELSALPAHIHESFLTHGVAMTFGGNGFFE